MGSITRRLQIVSLMFLVMVFFTGAAKGNNLVTYPEPASCDSDIDCLKGKARCIRRECHCIDKFAFGDGKAKCEKWKQCSPALRNTACTQLSSKNVHCLEKSSSEISCRCDKGYFGRSKSPGCLHGEAGEDGKFPCLTDKNCPRYSECVDKRCKCRHELIGDGEKCKRPKLKSCSSNKECNTQHGKCFDGQCHCVGTHVGDGVHCRDTKPCTKQFKCTDKHAICLTDPLFPANSFCRCDLRKGYVRSKNGSRCIADSSSRKKECSSDKDCNPIYSSCYKGICKCKDELIRDGETCNPAPLHECREDNDCDKRAKCDKGKCICQGNTTGNGKYCRVSLPCSPNHQCGTGGICVVDPLFPSKQKCRCDKSFIRTKNGTCTECLSHNDCDKHLSTCVDGMCICKDELIKEGNTCKHAPLHLCDEEHKCHEKAKCMFGKCYCQGNSTGNGIFCRDSLECPKGHQCGNHSVCVVDPLFPDTPDCKCDLEYKKSVDGKCEKMTECSKKGLLCTNDTICGPKSDGSFDCLCKKGFEMKTAHGINNTCQDIDECKHKDICAMNSTCANSMGSYKCCMVLNGTEKCEEPKEENCSCGKHEECHYQKCFCKKGYLKNNQGSCVPGAHQPSHMNIYSSRSSSTTGQVILFLLALLGKCAFG
ncbi:tenascin-like [Stylophora pistillata]|uniref:tenascin-like n=1 Tax=Stylophora pistillata TaxID=50429 RepID=UPI000C03A231|nr:tenascin-like [Stylophora pistillata]